MNPILAQLASRKFILSTLALMSLNVLCWNGLISDGVYSTCLIATVGAYLTANVVQKKTTTP